MQKQSCLVLAEEIGQHFLGLARAVLHVYCFEDCYDVFEEELGIVPTTHLVVVGGISGWGVVCVGWGV